MQKVFLIITAVILGFFSTGFSNPRAAKIQITVSIAPQKYFVKRIGGDRVDVNVMVPAGADPHSFEPKPRQMIDISKSEVYFTIGIDFERSWIERFKSANKNIKIVETDAGMSKISVPVEKKTHIPRHNNTEHDKDPHTWLSPNLAIYQSRVILETLKNIDPDHADVYQQNFDSLKKDILALDDNLKKIFASGINKKFIVFHPSWGYFAREYGLEQVPLEIYGKEPKPAELAEIIKLARKENIKTVFAQPQFSSKTADTIAKAIDGVVVQADPLAENWLENMNIVAEKFRTSMEQNK